MPADVLEIFIANASVSKISDNVSKVSLLIVLAELAQNILLPAATLPQ